MGLVGSLARGTPSLRYLEKPGVARQWRGLVMAIADDFMASAVGFCKKLQTAGYTKPVRIAHQRLRRSAGFKKGTNCRPQISGPHSAHAA